MNATRTYVCGSRLLSAGDYGKQAAITYPLPDGPPRCDLLLKAPSRPAEIFIRIANRLEADDILVLLPGGQASCLPASRNSAPL